MLWFKDRFDLKHCLHNMYIINKLTNSKGGGEGWGIIHLQTP